MAQKYQSARELNNVKSKGSSGPFFKKSEKPALNSQESPDTRLLDFTAHAAKLTTVSTRWSLRN